MTRCISKAAFGAVLGAGLVLAAVSIAKDSKGMDQPALTMLSPSDLKWTDAPPVLPAGRRRP